MSAGLEAAQGDAVVIIDADLQDPPEVILEMIAKWRTGVDVAYGRRKSRDGESTFKLVTASLFYRFFAMLIPYPVPVDTGDFKLCDRAVVDTVCALPEKRRYLRSLVPWAGFHHAPVDYDRDARTAGETKYSAFRLLSLAADAVLLSSDKPVRFIWFLATLFAFVGTSGLVSRAYLSFRREYLSSHDSRSSRIYIGSSNCRNCYRRRICCPLLSRGTSTTIVCHPR